MKSLDLRASARAAVSTNPTRPATAVIYDSEDLRLVVFRIARGQQVPPHTSHATVTLTVLEGSGTLSGGDGESSCKAGDFVVYEPGEIHGMKAGTEELLILASITPRPGSR